MSVPPVQAVPSLSTWQWSWMGYTFGADSDALHITKIEGLDVQSVRTGDAGRSREPGRWIGLDLLDGRDITITGDVLLTAGQWKALSRVLVAGGTVESPLYVNVPGFGVLVAMVRVRKHTMPIDIQAALGKLANIVIQFSASDPRLYETPVAFPFVGLPPPPTGFSFPLTFPLTFGVVSSPNVMSLTNDGNIPVSPIVAITGPCTVPTVHNDAVPGDLYMQFGLSLNAGDWLVVDCDAHSATLYTEGSSQGASRTATLSAGSTWLSLLPASGDVTLPGGVNYLRFTSADVTTVAGTMAVQWAPAWIL